MRLTPFGKFFLALVVIVAVGFVVYRRYGGGLGDTVRGWAASSGTAREQEVTKDDFSALGEMKDLQRDEKVPVGSTTASANAGAGKLDRPLRVALNTWAGHAPGIVANGGMDPGSAASIYKKKYGLDVQFVLIEDPVAKLNAFIKGDIDIMWDTVDSWANEASRLAEQGLAAKAILQEDWSRGGDGIVSLSSIRSIEDLKGKKVATTKFTPSHWFLLYMLSQSGLTPQERTEVEKSLVYFNEAPQAAAAFKAGKVDAAVTWEPDLSGAVTAREGEAHILISTTAASHVIADTLVARQDVIDRAPESIQAFVAGWFDAVSVMKEDPASTNAVVAAALKLTPEDVSGMLSGLKISNWADNAQFFGLSSPKPYFNQIFNSAFVVWRKKAGLTKVVDARDHGDSRFVAALAKEFGDQKVEESFAFKDKPQVSDRAIVNKSLSIHFMTGKDEIMPGSYFTLDSLGETMMSFGNTYLRVEGNTDDRGGTKTNQTLSQKRAEAVKAYLIQNFKIPPERFIAVGLGESNPVAPNTTEDGRALNRRTDIKVVLNTQ